MSAAPTSAPRVSARAWWIWGLGTSAYLVALFHRMILGVAGGDAADRLHVTQEALGVFAFLQLAIYAGMQIPAGLAADRIGPRRTLAIGLVCLAVGETAFALAHGLPLALAGRALVGAGDALTFINVLRLAHSWFPEHRQAMLAAMVAAAGGIGQLGATLPLQLALTDFGWAATFLVVSGLTALLALLALAALRDRPAGVPAPPAHAHERIGPTLREAWRRTGTRHGFFAHMSLLGPFAIVTAIWGVPYLEQAQGLAADTAATYVLVCVAAFTAGLPLVGVISGRSVGAQNRMLVGMGVALVAAWVTLMAWPGGVVARPVLLAALVVLGFAGAASVASFDIARREAPPAAAGAAVALVNCGGFLSAAGGAFLIGILLGPHAGPERWQHALLPVLLAITVVGLAQSARLGRRRRQAAAPAVVAACPVGDG